MKEEKISGEIQKQHGGKRQRSGRPKLTNEQIKEKMKREEEKIKTLKKSNKKLREKTDFLKEQTKKKFIPHIEGEEEQIYADAEWLGFVKKAKEGMRKGLSHQLIREEFFFLSTEQFFRLMFDTNTHLEELGAFLSNKTAQAVVIYESYQKQIYAMNIAIQKAMQNEDLKLVGTLSKTLTDVLNQKKDLVLNGNHFGADTSKTKKGDQIRKKKIEEILFVDYVEGEKGDQNNEEVQERLAAILPPSLKREMIRNI